MHLHALPGKLQAGQGRRADMIGSCSSASGTDPGSATPGTSALAFTQAMLNDLARQLAPLRRAVSPSGTTVPAQYARDARWVEPRLADVVAFTEWTTDMIMSHPASAGSAPARTLTRAHRET